ncbi:MAG: hypothetical protein IIC87_06015 [Chloroflexi bacterium]|nr:hypothetical protein [Chloroflexota bacterium]
MKMWGDRQRQALRRGATGVALFLAGLLAVVLLIVGTGSIAINALSTGDPINLVQDIDFGIVVPGEDYPDDFEICIKDAASGDKVDYTLTLNPQGSLPDMRPFLVVVRDPAELDDETDAEADGTAGDYEAAGDLDEDAATNATPGSSPSPRPTARTSTTRSRTPRAPAPPSPARSIRGSVRTPRHGSPAPPWERKWRSS